MFSEILNKKEIVVVGQCADELGLDAYLIGGVVRDVFLNRGKKDFDIVTVGSGIELATRVKNKLGDEAYLAVFKNFGTAQVKIGDIELEFVGARKESYDRNSRKPFVEDGTLQDDQNRRDFTINAMAMSLSEADFGRLIDPFNGLVRIFPEKLPSKFPPLLIKISLPTFSFVVT